MRFVCLFAVFVSTLPAQSAAVLAGLKTGAYFPLDVGDRWVFRDDTRFNTAGYETWRVDRTVTVNGQTYYAVDIEGYYGGAPVEYFFRVDASGRIYLLTGGGDQLFLDPTAMGQSTGMVQLTTAGGPAATALGTFPDTVNYVNPMGLDLERGVLARGIGLISSTVYMETGSSGGPTLIRTLVEANVAGIHFPADSSSISLGMETLNLDVSGKQVTNCAVPCYFAACYIAPGADPPGTYKPCARARVELRSWPAAQSRSVRLQLLAPDGSVAFAQTLQLDAAQVESVGFVQVPLYSAPNVPLPAGVYQLTAKSADGAAQAGVTVTIQ